MRTAHLTGDTYEWRDTLRKDWAWDAPTKSWAATAEWQDEAEVKRYLIDRCGKMRRPIERGRIVVTFDLAPPVDPTHVKM